MDGQCVVVAVSKKVIGVKTFWCWMRANSFAPPWLPGRWQHPLVGYLVATVAQGVAVLMS